MFQYCALPLKNTLAAT